MKITDAERLLGCGKRDSLLILSGILHKPESFCAAERGYTLGTAEESALKAVAERIKAGEPIQYILGEWEFMSLPMKVGSGVLIPRADTEILCETALSYLRTVENPRLLDLCTGTGCIAVALLHYIKTLHAVAADISETALSYTRANAEGCGVADRLCTVSADVTERLAISGSFDAVTCNPPYIPSGDIAKLDYSVRGYEPLTALDGGTDGLDFYRAVTENAAPLINTGGRLFFEVGIGEAASVADIMSAAGYAAISVYRDYAGTDRVVAGRRDR